LNHLVVLRFAVAHPCDAIFAYKVEGIGRYTASAIASIAYGVEVPVVDGNVCRVLSRLTGVANHIKAAVFKDDLGWVLAEKIVQARPESQCDGSFEVIGYPGEVRDVQSTPSHVSRYFPHPMNCTIICQVNQALMELGATYCSPSGTGIEDQDPLKQFYLSTRLGSAIGQSMRSNNLDLLPPATGSRFGNDVCRLCDPDGISCVFYDITDRITESTKSTTSVEKLAAASGHASIPVAPPKKAKRQEVLAVAVICLEHANKADNCWLMIKRPDGGLLAGQWEFPSVCVWDSSKVESKKDKKAKTKSLDVQVPHIDASVRSAELGSFLSSILQSDNDSNELIKKRVQVTDPIVHVFSHVCHTMYVEKSKVRSKSVPEQRRWQTKDGREIGWFTKSDMKDSGITSGVRKVLALSEQA
jgi:A/G-specific adenine glycosylase